jgi:ABC-type amino acid transport substrate-binding protein
MKRLALSLVFALASFAAAAADKSTIVMGVRIDAPPFAWRDDLNDSYLGYLVDICVDAAARANYPVVQVPIDATQRLTFFRGKRPDIDLLCDPTTITLGRMGDFAALDAKLGLEFTPIVFVANGGYVENPVAAATPASGGGCVAGPAAATQAKAKPSEVVGTTELPSDAGDVAAGFVTGTTGQQVLADAIRRRALKLDAAKAVCPVEFRTHWDAARAFCAGKLRYYFGDQDILRSVIAMIRSSETCDVAADLPPRPLSYEPYALVVTARTPGFRQDFVKALYEVFHHRTAAARFATNFPGRAMSPPLEALFSINQIPQGENPVAVAALGPK